MNEALKLADEMQKFGVTTMNRWATDGAAMIRSQHAEIERLRFCFNEWLSKTEWVQEGIQEGTLHAKYLGFHRADIISMEIDRLKVEIKTEQDLPLRERVKAQEEEIDRMKVEIDRMKVEIETEQDLPLRERVKAQEEEIDSLTLTKNRLWLYRETQAVELRKLKELLREYVEKVPLGNQPHLLAEKALKILGKRNE